MGDRPQAVAASENFIYVTNIDDDNVSVIDIHTNTLATGFPNPINVGDAPYGVAASGNYIYVTNVFGSNVSVIDTVTNRVVATIGVGALPVGVAASGNYIYVTNFFGSSVSVIFIGTSTTDPSTWTTYFQSLPMPASDSCADISAEQNTFAAYNANVTGGWVKGWEPWVNNNTGGFACWRNLVNTGGNNWRTTSTP